jgi:hypothetical protein
MKRNGGKLRVFLEEMTEQELEGVRKEFVFLRSAFPKSKLT